MKIPPLERIMRHVKKHKKTDHWEWVGKCRTGSTGEYGGTRLYGKMMSSHRAVWILTKGYVPKDLLHQCDMKLCCNPSHLKEGTHQENIMEAIAARGGKTWGAVVPGEEHGARKLSYADEDAIAVRIANGEAHRSIATDYKVTQACISIAMKRWRARQDCGLEARGWVAPR